MDTAKQIVNFIYETFNLSDEEIARRVESSQPTIWRIRTGETKNCTSSLYVSLANLKNDLIKKQKKVA